METNLYETFCCFNKTTFQFYSDVKVENSDVKVGKINWNALQNCISMMVYSQFSPKNVENF